MIGAIAGDIIGSVYEARPIKTVDFPLFSRHSCFTDDSVLTLAVAEAILDTTDYAAALRAWARRYPNAGYGMSFFRWVFDDTAGPYNSWGNGSAMRVSPVGFAFNDEARVLKEAEKSAIATHNHPEGVKGAQATALAVYLARTGSSKADMRKALTDRYGYDLDRRLDDIRPAYRFDISCQGTVPAAFIAFYESTDYQDAVRKAISLGGDSDTLACITGGLAQAFYGAIARDILKQVRNRLPNEFLAVINRFNEEFDINIHTDNDTFQPLSF
jgi:ADP-ribosylglycohydrolase